MPNDSPVRSHHDAPPKPHELGTHYPPYTPTFEFDGDFVDSYHAALARAPTRDGVLIKIKDRRWLGRTIPGWLRREDALKLYELAYCCQGDILELGCAFGLSTTILARANCNSPVKKHIYSVDLGPDCVKATQQTLRRAGLDRNVTLLCGDAVDVLGSFVERGMTFGLVFVDHDHAYESVLPVCQMFRSLLNPAGHCLFHDYNDARNLDPTITGYGVYSAVHDGLSPDEFAFAGCYGCTGLFELIDPTSRQRLIETATIGAAVQ
jgi:predicted O-methyltransferase YrrM